MTTSQRPIPFEQLLRRMPVLLAASFDPLQHKRAEDLAWIAQFELDLHDEGEQRLTAKQRIGLKAFIALCKEGR